MSASKKQKRAGHRLGLGAREALRWPGRGPGRAPQALSPDPGREGAGCEARSGRAQGGSGVGVPRLGGAGGRLPGDKRAAPLSSSLPQRGHCVPAAAGGLACAYSRATLLTSCPDPKFTRNSPPSPL